MSDLKELLERERQRFAMRDGTLEGLERRRNRKRRNGQIVAGVLALLIAAAGVGGGLFALRRSTGPRPGGQTPTPTARPAPGGPEGAPSQVSGPIQFVDDMHGWAVINGRIQATSDGGKTWSVQHAASDVTELAFVDAAHGWAITPSGLLRTLDGGGQWTPVGEPGVGFAEIQFKDDQVGWGVRLDAGKDSRPAGVVVKTTDGGNTWTSWTIAADSVCYASDGHTESVWAGRPGGNALTRSTDDGASWTDIPIEGPFDSEGWSASLQCLGNEAWLQLTDGGAAGHKPYGVFQSVDGGPARLVLQEAGTTPFGQQDGVYESEDPYPGPFTVVAAGAAYLMNWCPQCSASLPSVSITITAGQPAAVTDRFPVVIGDQQGQPLGVAFLPPEGSENVRVHGWALLDVSGARGSQPTILETTDGGRTWTVRFRQGP